MTGQELKEAILREKFTQVEIAQKMGVMPQSLTRIFKATDVRSETLRKVAVAMGHPEDHFLGTVQIEKESSDHTEDSMKTLVNELLTTVSMMQRQLEAAQELVRQTNERAELQHSEFLAVLKMMRSMGITFAPMSTSEPHPGMVAENAQLTNK